MSAPRLPLAWRNVTADTRKLARSASGITFAVLLILIQLGFEAGFTDSSTEIIQRLDGDLFLFNSQKMHFGDKISFPRTQMYQAAGVAGVASVRPLYGEWYGTYWKNPQTRKSYLVQVLAFDPQRPVFLFPEVNRHLDRLKQPDTVLVSSSARRVLGQMAAGLETELAWRRVEIIGTFPLGPDFVVDGTVIMGDRNFLKLFHQGREMPRLNEVEVGVVKVAAGADVTAVQADMRRLLPGNVSVVTKEQFVTIEAEYQASLAPVGPIFGLGTVIGFVVGTLITYQVLFGDLSDHLPQYATLKAIGYDDRFLIRTVLEQSMLYGVIGFVPAWVLAILFYAVVGRITLLPMSMTVGLSLTGLALTVGMCLASGLVIARRVLAVDPAEVM